MINAEQIRAARALLDWSTADLAKLTGLTVNGINKIEREHVDPQKDTLNVIQRGFEEAGLEFFPLSGVKKKDQIVLIWDDEEAYNRLLDDIYYELRDTGGEVLISGVDETVCIANIGRERLEFHISRLAKSNIVERMLIKEGDTNLVGPIESYHWMPKKYFSLDSFFIYGSKLALITNEKRPKAIIISDARMADSVRKLFDFVWDHTKPPKLPK